MKNYLSLSVLIAILFLSRCSDNEVTKTSPGYFTLSQLSSPHGRISSISESTTSFHLGDLKASKEFFFLLGNGGQSEITDITIETDNPKFVITPTHIDKLPGKNATDNVIIPLVSVGIIHGLALDGVGYRKVLPQGENNATITIKGSVVVNGNSTELTSTFNLKVNAKVMDVTLYSDNTEIDLANSLGNSIGLESESGLPGIPAYLFNPANIKIKNTGNVSVNVLLRMMIDPAPVSITLAPNEVSTLNIPISEINEIGVKQSFAEVTLDGDGTIADPMKIHLGTNGKGYLWLWHEE
jgi:hypothetical protein